MSQLKKIPKIPVLEIFGPTFQGEGRSIGQKTMFVRTGGCDYSCAWCDSAFTWDGSEKPDLLTADEILVQLDALGSYGHVTISGGNPLLHASIGTLVDALKSRGITMSVETQGSYWQNWVLDIEDVTISPKPPSSGMTVDYDRLDVFFKRLPEQQRAVKIVIFDEADLDFAAAISDRYALQTLYLSLGNPDPAEEGTIAPRMLSDLKTLWERVAADERFNHARVLPQLHALVFANDRGV
ncbi:7-carboxy-7-deazaguanine synthase QueE [Exiguobacterium artemiae]|uniref:7-carboxy-7-deazaguanine synthase QueE n=1 Tax=Exiguobacterium artemiae TaxID=340145 RepID=UPI002964DAB5|nr:7-carboxy-7-deazaguanine synthase QueE [Exiguobacterium sibiricum]MDW2885099.1 7-carboxy-7-deazaguanine synthase QueE [Exiguobacterium sibiricum]